MWNSVYQILYDVILYLTISLCHHGQCYSGAAGATNGLHEISAFFVHSFSEKNSALA